MIGSVDGAGVGVLLIWIKWCKGRLCLQQVKDGIDVVWIFYSFTLVYHTFIFSLPLSKKARHRLKNCIKEPFKRKQSTKLLSKVCKYDISKVPSRQESIIILGINPELLWMAPEILRRYPPRKTSQPGDVYSFAIILYEMCTRNEPYVTESWYQSLEGMDGVF